MEINIYYLIIFVYLTFDNKSICHKFRSFLGTTQQVIFNDFYGPICGFEVLSPNKSHATTFKAEVLRPQWKEGHNPKLIVFSIISTIY